MSGPSALLRQYLRARQLWFDSKFCNFFGRWHSEPPFSPHVRHPTQPKHPPWPPKQQETALKGSWHRCAGAWRTAAPPSHCSSPTHVVPVWAPRSYGHLGAVRSNPMTVSDSVCVGLSTAAVILCITFCRGALEKAFCLHRWHPSTATHLS